MRLSFVASWILLGEPPLVLATHAGTALASVHATARLAGPVLSLPFAEVAPTVAKLDLVLSDGGTILTSSSPERPFSYNCSRQLHAV